MTSVSAGPASQYVITRGNSRLCINATGASLRGLSLDGVTVIPTYPEGTPPFSAGIVLLPWANRIDGGRWVLDGIEQQLEITEPRLGHAIHGLLAATEYAGEALPGSEIELRAVAGPAPGYPFELHTSVGFALHERELLVTHSVTNNGTLRAPMVLGIHPYFRIGDHPIVDHTLTIEADAELVLDERYIPVRTRAVTTAADFRRGRVLDDADVHHALTGLTTRDGRVEHRLAVPGGPTATVWTDAMFDYVQVFLATEFPMEGGGTAGAIAIEPMTGPPNAFASGEGLTWIEPNDTLVARWGVRLAT